VIAQSSLQKWLPLAAVVLVAVLATAAGLGNRFAQDDVLLIEEHFLLHDLGNWRAILTAPYWPPPHTDALYRPVASLLHAIQYTVGGGSPLVLRIVSMALYALASLAVLGFARRLLHPAVALGVALLFAAHPVHVEATALGVNQGEILVALLAAIMATRYLDRRREGDGTLGPIDWIQLGGLYLIASLTKESGMVIPALLLAVEFCVDGPPLRARIRSLLPGYAGLATVALAVLAVRALILSGEEATPSRAEALDGLGIQGRVLTMLPVVTHWVRLLSWPLHLQADYAPQEILPATGFGPPQALGAAILVLMVGAGILARHRLPMLTTGLAWAGIALLPVSNLLFPTGIVLAERTLFLPSIGWLIAVGTLGCALWERAEQWKSRRVVHTALSVVTGLLVIAGVARSIERFSVWRDDSTYALRTGLDAPRSWRAQMARAEILFRSGERDAGEAGYREAVALAPPNWVWRVRNDLARRFLEIDEVAPAAVQLESSLAAVPDKEETRHYLVLSYLALARYEEAAEQADSALARGFNPELFTGLRALADTLLMEGAPPGSLRVNVRRGR
jgi:protein O-mannosyl-transferase